MSGAEGEDRKCRACGKPSTTVCPVCTELMLPETPYCSQACYKSEWKTHKKTHKIRAAQLLAESNGGGDEKGSSSASSGTTQPPKGSRPEANKGTCKKCGKSPAPYECPTCKEHVKELGETRYCSSACFTGDFAEHRRLHDSSGAVKVDPEAEIRYAGCLLLGLGGVSKDPSAAVTVFESLVSDGVPRAMAYLALCLEGGEENASNGIPPDGPRAVELFEKAASLGDPMAQAQLARILHEGRCKGGHAVEADPVRAAELYKLGSDAGDPLSRHMYACALDAGLGVERDPDAALALFEENADMYWESRLHAAGHYAMGRGVGDPACKKPVTDPKKDIRGLAAVTRALQLSCAEQAPLALYAFAQWMKGKRDADLTKSGGKGNMSLDERVAALESDAGETGKLDFERLPEDMQKALCGSSHP